MKTPMHKHLLLRGYCNKPPIDSELTHYWLKNLVEKINMKIIRGPFVSYVNEPGNRGTTAVVMIETSHIAFHVWDETDPALLQFDLYTCSSLNVPFVLEEIQSFFDMTDYQYLVFDRERDFTVIDGTFIINAEKQ